MDTLKARFFLIVVLVLAGCSKFLDQSTVESTLAGNVVKWLKLHDIDSPDVPTTNLVQLFRFVKHDYPYGIHAELARLGRRAGFTNAVSEKYIFFWPRFTNSQMDGEVVCMSAHPFGSEKALRRMYIAKSGSNYIQRMISEERAQAVMKEVKPNTVLPPSFAMPKPPPEALEILHPPLSQRYETFVWDLSEALGQESSMPVRWLLRGITVIATAALLGFWLWRRSRR